mmetsp:Transcript_47048/g.131148  ORF Transcript_47048/g.131148 Transcript_47048/m.131148 type:complete len:289 (-) Transcript_47048:90-956(-)
MGGGASNHGQLGSSLNGGRTTILGTFVAEKTHSNPPKYTLVSVSAAMESGGGALEVSPPSRGSKQGTRSATMEKGFVKLTQIKSVGNIEPLLSSDDGVARPHGASRQATRTTGPSGGNAAGVDEKAGPRLEPGTTAARQEKRAGDTGAPALAVMAPVGIHPVMPSPRQEVFNRLATHERPWVAEWSDVQLLTYLARRGRDPEIASTVGSFNASQQLSTTSTGFTKRPRRRHRCHRELFDTCLDRASKQEVAPKAAPKKHAGTRHLLDLLEDIAILPEDAVAAYLKDRR